MLQSIHSQSIAKYQYFENHIVFITYQIHVVFPLFFFVVSMINKKVKQIFVTFRINNLLASFIDNYSEEIPQGTF